MKKGLSFGIMICLMLVMWSVTGNAQDINIDHFGFSPDRELLLAGRIDFTESWNSSPDSREKGLWWKGDYDDPGQNGFYYFWENLVKYEVFEQIGQIVIQGPAKICVRQRGKGAIIEMIDMETGNNFLYCDLDGGSHEGYVEKGSKITLKITGAMTISHDARDKDKLTYEAPQHVEYEVWYVSRGNGSGVEILKNISDNRFNTHLLISDETSSIPEEMTGISDTYSKEEVFITAPTLHISTGGFEYIEEFSGAGNSYKVEGNSGSIEDGRLYWYAQRNATAEFAWFLPMEDFILHFDGYAEVDGINVHLTNQEGLGYSATFGVGNSKSGSDFGCEGENIEWASESIINVKKWHVYRVERLGDRFAGYCDDRLVFERNISARYEGPGKLWFSSNDSLVGLDNVRFLLDLGFIHYLEQEKKIENIGVFHWLDHIFW